MNREHSKLAPQSLATRHSQPSGCGVSCGPTLWTPSLWTSQAASLKELMTYCGFLTKKNLTKAARLPKLLISLTNLKQSGKSRRSKQ